MTLRQAEGKPELGTPIQGVTLYSFTRAFHGREYDLEGLVRKVAADGYGPGLEIIGFSSFRGFPEIDDRFAGWFRDLVDETGLVTTSLAVNADIGIHRDRLLTQDELLEYMRRQIAAAAKLGFPIARVQISITPDSMEALAPIAEEYGVTLALEVHADQYASHPRILALRDRYEKVGSPFLGFTMDWGATVSGFAPSLIEAYRRRGASEELENAFGRHGSASKWDGRARSRRVYDGRTSSWPGTIVAESSSFRSRSSHTPSRGSPANVRSAIDQSVSPGLTR